MKLKQVKNVSENFIWETKEGEVRACMIGQIAQALNPKGTPEAWEIMANRMVLGLNSISTPLAEFSDGTAQCSSEDYKRVCNAYRESYPELNLEFPEYDSYLAKEFL